MNSQTIESGSTRPTFRHALDQLHALGRDVIAPAAVDVDAAARFPLEALSALRAEGLLGAYVREEFGGLGYSMTEVCRICEILGQYCASTAMIFAMHQIQVACIQHHAAGSPYFREFLGRIADEQLLLASATTETNVGGDLRSSHCHLQRTGDGIVVEKNAPVISYGKQADAILVTCRRHPDAAESDQVMVVFERDQYRLEEISGWDTLGFRGTCSQGYRFSGVGHPDQVVDAPFADVLAQSMHPFAHLTWGSLWLGLAVDAVARARDTVRKKARKDADAARVSSIRLAELDETLFGMRGGLLQTISEYEQRLADPTLVRSNDYGFLIRVNNVKLTCSELVVDLVGGALRIVGLSGYRNDSESSLGRHLRDAYGAALMVSNERIRGHNAVMQIIHRER